MAVPNRLQGDIISRRYVAFYLKPHLLELMGLGLELLLVQLGIDSATPDAREMLIVCRIPPVLEHLPVIFFIRDRTPFKEGRLDTWRKMFDIALNLNILIAPVPSGFVVLRVFENFTSKKSLNPISILAREEIILLIPRFLIVHWRWPPLGDSLVGSPATSCAASSGSRK